VHTGESLVARSLEAPDQRLEFPDGRLDLVTVAERPSGRFTLQPGWRWSTSVGPSVGTTSCRHAHFGYVVTGSLAVRTDDGAEGVAHAGDVYWIAPGHDAWVVGDVPAVVLDMEGAAGYGER
jgi:hypothetical protein